VTGSLVNGAVAVMLVSGTVDDTTLSRWVDDLAGRFGQVEPRRANGQLVWQWVRERRMIRVTTRIERGSRYVSVSLVDGILLDGLGSS
jgi:hypothetical protein